MNYTIKKQLDQCEEQLRLAMLQSDIAALDKLLSSDLIFTTHLGRVINKEDDLQAHESGMVKINELLLSDQKYTILGDVAIITVQAMITGIFAGAESQSKFRFTRVWHKTNSDAWQVIVGHVSLVE